jgi:tRNA threonylcarbamoyl adenosine modification protein YjeE
MTLTPISIHLPDEAATLRLGEDIAAILKPGDVLALRGDLGMGKTTLARAIIRAVAADAELEVPSPTFTLVQAYAGRVPIQHFDLYRLGTPDEIEELGLAEAIDEGAVLVEWPERAGDALPADVVDIDLTDAGVGRGARIAANALFIGRLARSLAIRAFLDTSGYGGARRRFLVGDASTRAYETVETEGRDTVILMNSPRRPDGPPIRNGRPYSQIAHLAEDVVPFVAVGSVLRQTGFAAPAILARDLDAGLLLVEDLGREGVLDERGTPVPERYLAAARVLAEIHSVDWSRDIEVEPGVTHRVPDYDHDAMAIESELLVDWYVPHMLGRPASTGERRDFSAVWTALFTRLDRAERSLVLRDYHSPNLIWMKDRSARERVGLIDFQDAMMGPSAYDVASLAMDARVGVHPGLEQEIVEAYCTARGTTFDRTGFSEAYAIMAAQRNTKILGIFVRLKLRDDKPGYMCHLPRLRDYLRRALAHPSLEELAALYARLGVLDEPA